jgi:hypothetical protein
MTALERKQHTEKLLAKLGIHLIDELPPMEEESMVRLTTPQEIAERILVLTYLNCIASEQSLRTEVIGFLKQEGLWKKASEAEKKLFAKSHFTDEEEINIRWRGESIWMLLWTINKVEKLDLPVDLVNPQEVFKLLPAFMKDTRDFISEAIVRTKTEIMDQADFLFRLNWAIKQLESDGANELELSRGVAYERYYSLNWVTFTQKEWDEASGY